MVLAQVDLFKIKSWLITLVPLAGPIFGLGFGASGVSGFFSAAGVSSAAARMEETNLFWLHLFLFGKETMDVRESVLLLGILEVMTNPAEVMAEVAISKMGRWLCKNWSVSKQDGRMDGGIKVGRIWTGGLKNMRKLKNLWHGVMNVWCNHWCPDT